MNGGWWMTYLELSMLCFYMNPNAVSHTQYPRLDVEQHATLALFRQHKTHRSLFHHDPLALPLRWTWLCTAFDRKSISIIYSWNQRTFQELRSHFAAPSEEWVIINLSRELERFRELRRIFRIKNFHVNYQRSRSPWKGSRCAFFWIALYLRNWKRFKHRSHKFW